MPKKDVSRGPSPSKEMGKSFVSEALRHYQFVKDPEVVALVNRVGRRIVRSIGANPAGYHFLVVHEARPNAFAIPGGYIFVFDGLLTQLRDEEELAGVLAHEIAHVERNHFFKDAKKIAALDVATIAAILLGGGGMAAATIASAANIDIRLQFSRENEAEADSYALRYMKQAGYAPRGLLDFFDNLIRYERFNPQTIPAYVSTHPDLESRRNNVANFVKKESAEIGAVHLEGIPEQKMNWMRVLAILTSYDGKEKEESSLSQVLRIDEIPEGQRGEARDYLLGVAYMKAGRFNEAISKYLAAIERNRESPIYYTDLSFCYLKQQDLVRAREAALQGLRLKGDYAPAHLILGILDMDTGSFDEAISHLQEALNIDPDDPSTNFHLALAYKKIGDQAKGAYYSARYLRLTLNPDEAIRELNMAKGLVREDSPFYYSIVSEIKEIEREGL